MKGNRDEQHIRFGTALKAIRAGKDVQRASWSSKLVYLFLVKGNTLTAAISGKNGIYRGNSIVPVADAIYICTADNQLVPWTLTQADLLANDWQEC